MYGSGAAIGIAAVIIASAQAHIRKDRQAVLAGFFAAARGTLMHTSAGLLIGAAIFRLIRAKISVFE